MQDENNKIDPEIPPNAPQELPLSYGFVTPVSAYSWVKAIFQYKVIVTVAFLSAAAGCYILNLQKTNLVTQLELANTKMLQVESERNKCEAKFSEMSDKFINFSKNTSDEINLEIQDLKTKIERYNKINRDNAITIEKLNETALAGTCEDAIAELVESFK